MAVMSLADSARAASRPQLPPQGKTLIIEAYHLWTEFAETIWPGASSVKAPFVYIDGNYEYAIGFPGALEGFKDIGDSLLDRPVQVRERTFAPDLSASFPLEGIPAVLMGSPEKLGKSFGNWVITAGHEMFHVFQAAKGSYEKVTALEIGPKGDGSWQLTFPFPYRDADAMRLIHLQGYLVWLAAQSSNQDDAKYIIGTAVDATSVYRSYLAGLTSDERAYRYSQFQEWNEGVAAYFEYRLAEKAAGDTYRPSVGYSSLPMAQRYTDVWRESYESRPFLTKHAGRAAKSRDAFYHLGAGKALALDKVDAGWKMKYFGAGVWLDDLLAETLR
jgi:hypothetical protein